MNYHTASSEIVILASRATGRQNLAEGGVRSAARPSQGDQEPINEGSNCQAGESSYLGEPLMMMMMRV